MEWSRAGAKQIPEPWLLITSLVFFHWIILTHWGQTNHNKANLRDVIAATGLVISSWIQIIDFFPWKFDGWPRKTIGTSSILCQALCIISIPSGEFKTGVTVRKLSIQIEIGNILSCVTLKFDGWHWKTKGHLFYTTLSFVHHFKAMGEFKLELRFGNAQFGSKSASFCLVWPWNLTDDHEKL